MSMNPAADAVVEVSANTAQAEAAFARLEARTRTFGQRIQQNLTSLDKFGVKLQSIGRFMTSYVTLPLAALGVAATKMAMDFGQAMANVDSLLKVSNEELATMSQEVRDLALELPQTATQLAEGLYNVASGGFEGADAMTVLEQSARAASAGMTDTDTAAKGIIQSLKAYGMGASEAADVSDILFTAVDKGIPPFQDLVSTMGDYVGTAHVLGVALSEAVAAQAAMTLSGLSAAEAATSLNRVLTSIIDPSEKLSAVFADWGYESGQAAIEALTLEGVVERLAEQFGTNAEALQALFPEQRAFRGITALMANDGENFNTVLAAMEDRVGATGEALAEQAKGPAYQFQLAMNRLRDSMIDLGNTIIPILQEDIIPAIQGVADWFSNLDEGAKEMMVRLGMIAAVVGPILLIFGGLVRAVVLVAGAFKTVIGWMASLEAGATSLAYALGGTGLLGTLAALGPEVALLIAGLVTFSEVWQNAFPPETTAEDRLDAFNQKVREVRAELQGGGTILDEYGQRFVFTAARVDAAGNQIGDEMTLLGQQHVTFAELAKAAGISEDRLRQRLNDATYSLHAEAEALGMEADAQTEAAAATNAHAAASRALRLAELAAAGGVAGIIASFQSYKQAQTDLNTAIKEHGRNSIQARQASLALLQAQLGLTQTVQDLKGQVQEGDMTMGEARQALIAYGRQAGLTKNQMAPLIEQLKNGITQGRLLKTTLEDAEGDYSASFTLNTYVKGPAAGLERGQLGGAHGGVVGAQTGGIARGPMLMSRGILVGEGRYSTPFGRGAEAILPLTDQMMRRLGRAINKEGGRNITVNASVNVSGGLGMDDRALDLAADRVGTRIVEKMRNAGVF